MAPAREGRTGVTRRGAKRVANGSSSSRHVAMDGIDGLMKRYLDRIASKPNVVVISSPSRQASAGREDAFNYRTLRDKVASVWP